jgi:hypothetical protein
MRRISKCILALLIAGMSTQARAQVLSPPEIKDNAARALQQKYLPELKAIAKEMNAHTFPYSFYFSRMLDIGEEKQQRVDQRSIRFEKYEGQTVLMMTGNYYAAYSADLMDSNKRVRKTMDDVIMPLLKAAVPPFANDDGFAAFALEVSHHVRRRVMGIQSENSENVVFVVPRAAAQHMVTATNDEQLQAALLDSQVFIDAQPFTLWVNGDRPSDEDLEKMHPHKPAKGSVEVSSLGNPPAPASVSDATVSPRLLKAPDMPVRLITPKTMSSLKTNYAAAISRMTSGLSEQAHFAAYAPPNFIGFHQGAYLQLSLETQLDNILVTGSRYKLAALAFDEHISHLIRPVLAYFQQSSDFDGIVFSTTVKQPGQDAVEAVEYFFPLANLRSFAQYDCTGQQLIDSGFVLINGERSELNLQIAEADGKR